MAALPVETTPADRALLAEELARLKSDYRRVLARQADEDYSRRRAEWRTEQAEVPTTRRAGHACA